MKAMGWEGGLWAVGATKAMRVIHLRPHFLPPKWGSVGAQPNLQCSPWLLESISTLQSLQRSVCNGQNSRGEKLEGFGGFSEVGEKRDVSNEKRG